jgi:NADH-quinone oxidoreductase subunit E
MRRTFPDEVDDALARYPVGREASAVLSLLYLAQAAYGYLTDEAIAEVASTVGLPPTHVRGLAGFYTLLYERPTGGYVIHFCTDLPCALRGAEPMLDRLCAKLGIEPGETTADGLFTVEAVMCLAACDRAPMMQVNLEYYEDLTDERLDEIIADLRERASSSALRRPPLGFGPPSEMALDSPAEARGIDGHRQGDDA